MLMVANSSTDANAGQEAPVINDVNNRTTGNKTGRTASKGVWEGKALLPTCMHTHSGVFLPLCGSPGEGTGQRAVASELNGVG